MRKIKVHWYGEPHNIQMKETDQGFKELIAELEGLKGLKIRARACYEGGIGVPAEYGGHDVRIIVHRRKGPFGLFTGEEVADLELRLDAWNRMKGDIHFLGDLPPDVAAIANDKEYDFLPRKRSFVPDTYF